MQLDASRIADFQATVWDYYRTSAREMPWRINHDAYRVLVSELMLQQTQVGRVVPKFEAFMERFPTIQALARAPLSDVLVAWSGLGYNRRAKFLHQAAQLVMTTFGGIIPGTLAELVQLPGVGINTAGAVLAYAYNEPVLFIETNIRTVYLHHFFQDEQGVDDKAIRNLLEQTMDRELPREWYWALMDYGTYLKRTAGNNIDRSKHYSKQSRFEGSLRQLRGKVLKALTIHPYTTSELGDLVQDERLAQVLAQLEAEGFMTNRDGMVKLTEAAKLP
jgi:A/G-specific adenine glycosylase